MVKEIVHGIDGKPLKAAKREAGYFYFVDTDGTMMRAKMSRGKKLSPDEIKRREAAKAAKTAAYNKRVEANRAKKAAKFEEVNKRALAGIAARKAKAAALTD